MAGPETAERDGSGANRHLERVQEYLKQIVYGGNDGIVTTFSVVAGFAGAQASGVESVGGVAVLLFGLANLFSDGTAMGLGEYLSSRSERDVYTARRTAETRGMRENPAGRRDALASLLEARGLDPDDSRQISAAMVRNPEFAADFVMRYESGMASPDGDAPAARGLMTFVAFVLFGSAPLIPYILFDPVPGTFLYSILATVSALVLLGLLRWRVTDAPLARSVGETVLIGGVCAVIAYLVGTAFR